MALRPVGRVSWTVTVPLDGPLPPFCTVSVYVAPFSPWLKFPVWLLETLRSGSWSIVVGSEAVSFEVFSSPPWGGIARVRYAVAECRGSSAPRKAR